MTNASTTITTTTTNTPTTTDPTVQAMINQAVAAALAAANKTPQKSEAEIKAERAANAIKNNLGGRIFRDLENDASVRVGLRTAMSQSLIAGGALGALGYTEDSARLLAQGEAARLAQRKGLRAEGATGTIRAGLSYIPLVGDVFLGGDSISERALYAQQNAAAAQQQAMGEVAMMIAPVAEQIKGFLSAGAGAASAAAAASNANAQYHLALTGEKRLGLQDKLRVAQAGVEKAQTDLDTARSNESTHVANCATIAAGITAGSGPTKAQLKQAEADLHAAQQATRAATAAHLKAMAIQGEIAVALAACG